MGMRVFYALAAAAVLMALPAFAAKEAPADAAWRACMAEPARACVAARAMKLTRAIPTPPEQAMAVDRVLSAAGGLQMPETVALARDAEAQIAGVDWEAGREDMRLSIATAYARMGDFAAAKAMLPRFTNPSLESAAVIEIAVALGRARSIAEAAAFLRSERSTKDAWRAWSHAAWQLRGVAVERGEEAALLPLLQEAQAAKNAERAKATGPGFFVTGHASQYVEPLLIIAAEFAAYGRSREALALGRAERDATARRNIVGGIGAVLARAGRTDEALDVALASQEEQGEAPKAWRSVVGISSRRLLRM